MAKAYPERLEDNDGCVEYIEDETLQSMLQRSASEPEKRKPKIVNWKNGLKLAVLALLGIAIFRYINAPACVSVITIKTVLTTQTLGATGKVRGERVTDLGLDVPGIVQNLAAHNGDRLHAGQLIASLDPTDSNERISAAQAAVNSSLAELARSSKGSLPSEIARARAELAQAASVGQAKVAEAEARLRNLQAGTRRQEIKAAQADLQAKGKLLNKAQSDYQRTQKLVNAGALAASNLDSAQADVDTANAAYVTQQEHLSLLKEGASVYELQEARAAVAEAKAARDTQTRAARETLNTLLSYPRREDVAAARAKVDEARAEFRRVVSDRTKTDLRAPFDGVVADVAVEQGQSVQPGQKLVSFHEMSRPIIEIETDESNLNNLHIGQHATVTSDAYPGRYFNAVVTDLGSMVNPEKGTVQLKLRPTGLVNWLRPDLTADVNIVTGNSVHSIIVPSDCLFRYNRHSAVMVVRDNVAVPIYVTTGAASADGVVVIGRLKDGDRVIRNANQVHATRPVQIVDEE